MNMVKECSIKAAEGDVDSMRLLVPAYRALKILKSEQEKILEACLMSGVDDAIDRSLKVSEKMEKLLKNAETIYKKAEEVFKEEQKK